MLKVHSAGSVSNPIKLSKSEKIWLREIIKSYFKREKIDLITLRVSLDDKLENDFDHTKIAYTLICNNTQPTLYSVWIIDPANGILALADKVLKHIKELVKKDPSVRRFSCIELSSNLNYPQNNMDLCIELIYSTGLFFNSASSTADRIYGYNQVEVTSIEFIKNILAYKDLKTIFGKSPFSNLDSANRERSIQINEPIEFSNAQFISTSRIHELRNLNSQQFDLVRLIKLCEEVNTNYKLKNYMSVVIICRAILDHIPPIFSFDSFDKVANNYGGSKKNKSIKGNLSHLNISLRNIADKYLHQIIRTSETLPNETQINFSQDLDVLLEEIVRLLK